MVAYSVLKPAGCSKSFQLFLLVLWMGLASLAFASEAQAQTVNRYTNTTDSSSDGINDGATPCSKPFKRTFSVGTSFTVADVNIGVLAAHSWRGDLVMYLVSPTGTRVQLLSGQGGSADNFNAVFDDEASNLVSAYTASDTATSTTAVPPYNGSYRPVSALTAFDGQNASGTWTLEICDQGSGDSGTFYQADLYLTQAPTNYADLSLSKTVSSASPAVGATITYTISVSNAAAANLTATGVTVRDLLPSGVSYVSYSGTGTYNPTTGDWSVGSVAPGQSRSLTITATVTAPASAQIFNNAEITASSVVDLDSTPNNGATTEDDYATASFTVAGTNTAGTPPTLTCSAGSSLLDWDANTWSAGARTGSYAISGFGTVGFTVATSGSGDPTLSGQPVTSSTLTGGAATHNNLYLGYDFFTQSQESTVTMTLPSASPGVQFRILDVDYGANSWADHVTITGIRGGLTVLPTLTNGTSNWVTGNEAFGSAGSTNTQANGNLTVTFQSPVDTIIVRYGNHAAAPADPQGQVIGIDDITFCKPVASISVTKISTVISDPVNGSTNPKAIPGALMEYCILVSNTGTATLTNIAVADTLPANFTYAIGTLKTGTNCAAATTAEDDDNSGADESDPFGAAIAGTAISASASSLGSSNAFALKFRGAVN